MNPDHYDNFKKATGSGNKTSAASHLWLFIDSFRSFEEKSNWTRWYLENERYGPRIRNEIYEQIIFPVLLDGYLKSDPWSFRWLARTSQNFYSKNSLWDLIDRKTEQALLLELIKLCPNDEGARESLLSLLIKSMEYMVHEWPAGILYGCNGATVDECQEIQTDLELARNLDKTMVHQEFLADFSQKLSDYQERIINRKI